MILGNMRKLFSLLAIIFFHSMLRAQQGAPLLTHFVESREIENQSWAICQDVNNVMLFANRRGVLSFDGQEWYSTRIPTIPFSMALNPKNGKIFIGGDNSYGLLERDRMGLYNYVALSEDSTDIGIITKIIFSDSLVWFYGEHSISRYNLDNGKLELRLKPKNNNPFTGMFITPANTFVNVMNKGLYRLESDTLFPIVTGYLTEKIEILFSLPYNNKMVLVGLGNGDISLFDGIKYYDFPIGDDGYLKENILSEGITVGDSLYAFSTLEGGAMVVNKKDGKIRHTINNQNELPDDEVFALGLDNSGGLWISHQYGLTRADLNLPVGNFSIYTGLKGNLTNSLRFNNELYVATSEGIFYLKEIRTYASFQVIVRNKQENTVPESVNKTEELVQPKAQQGSRKNIFSRIIGKIIVKDRNQSIDTTPQVKAETPSPISRPDIYTTKTVNKLKSVNYVYTKVEGLNEKCRQLVSTPNGILAATNRGLFIINNHKATPIVENRYINFIRWQMDNNRFYVAANDGYFSVNYEDGKWNYEVPDPRFTFPVYTILGTNSNKLWIGLDNEALIADLNNVADSVIYTPVIIEHDFLQRYTLDLVNDSVFMFTESGIYFYDNRSNEFMSSTYSSGLSGAGMKYIYPLSNLPWVKLGDNWICLETGSRVVEKEKSLLKIFDDVISINAEDDYLWVIDGENRLFRIELNKPSNINPEIDVFVKSIYDERGNTFDLSNIVSKRGNNIFYFDIVAPGYLKQRTTQYQYTIDKLMTDWSPWSVQTNYNLMITVPGEYTLQVRAKDLWGNVGEPKSINFIIEAPFTQTTFFYVLLGLVVIVLLVFFIRFRERQLQKKNKLLEEKVRDRTAEIAAQKEEITSSIEYASRIQMAMLPMEDHFKTFFSDYFIIFMPRDIVSGDFYWIGEGDDNVFFTVADCTGHGVPGAFMSTLGISTLNEIIANNDDLHANTILKVMREKIKTSLHQTGKEGEAADGMDLAFCVMSKDKKTLQYSGAYNPLFIFQRGKMKEYKADRMPIGIHYGERESFTNHDIKIRKGDTLYIFSDGLSDQFGGPNGSKYKISNLKKLLLGIHGRPMADQRKLIEKEFEKWRGSNEQVDDITMIGLKI